MISLARAVRVVRHGRTLLAGGRAVRGIEPGAGATGGASGRVALEQCAGTLVGARRLFGEGRPLAGDGWRLECCAQQRPSRRGVGGIAWARPNRPSARGRVVLGSLGGSCWPRPEAAERRPAKKSVKPVLCPPIDDLIDAMTFRSVATVLTDRCRLDGRGLDALLSENTRLAKMKVNTGRLKVLGLVSREGRWGWDGACLETVSAIAHDPVQQRSLGLSESIQRIGGGTAGYAATWMPVASLVSPTGVAAVSSSVATRSLESFSAYAGAGITPSGVLITDPLLTPTVTSTLGSSSVWATSITTASPSIVSGLAGNILANLADSAAARGAGNGFLQLDRQAIAQQFYAGAGFSPNQIAGHLQGIDFSQPVQIVTIPYGATAQQFVGPEGVGNYFAPYGTSALQSGVDAAGRNLTLFQSMGNTPALQSTVAPYIWPRGVTPGAGGGIQYFVPNKNILVPIAR